MSIRFKLLALLAALVVNSVSGNNSPIVEFENSSEELTESGYIKLSWRWKSSNNEPISYDFELQQSRDKDFRKTRTIYKGADYATFLSGLKNGIYYYRVRATKIGGAEMGDWSVPILVKVEHHSLQLAFTLFGIGTIVFLLTVGIVIQGNRTTALNP